MMRVLTWPLLALAQTPAVLPVVPAGEPMTVPTGVAPLAVPAEPVLVVIAVDRELSSKTVRIDEFFPIRLKFALTVGGRTVLPAGIAGEGQVVHVNRAKGLGKGGELIVAARYLQCGSQRLALRGFRLDGAGSDKAGALVAATAAVGMIATPLLFIKGGEFIIPAGTIGQAKLVAELPADACMGETPPPAAPTTVSQQGVTQ